LVTVVVPVESPCGCPEVVSGRLSVTDAADCYELSRQHIYRLLQRCSEGGLDAVDPRSRRPASNPHTVSDEVIAAVVHLREQLTADGLDAGPVTLQCHLHQAGLAVPSTSTIRSILHHHGLIARNSYHRFAAEQPTGWWQSDFTHWTLADGSDTEILNCLDDHSRYLLSCAAYRRVGGPDEVATFTTAAAEFGLPAATLNDNGSVYTSRFMYNTQRGRPRPPPQIYPRTGLPGSTHSRPRRPTHRALPHPPRRRGPIRQTHPASRQPPAPPRHRLRPRPHPVLILVTTTVTVISKTGHHILSSHTINPEKTTGSSPRTWAQRRHP
jgi:hypothetical protein